MFAYYHFSRCSYERPANYLLWDFRLFCAVGTFQSILFQSLAIIRVVYCGKAGGYRSHTFDMKINLSFNEKILAHPIASPSSRTETLVPAVIQASAVLFAMTTFARTVPSLFRAIKASSSQAVTLTRRLEKTRRIYPKEFRIMMRRR